jgi:hypothetical protein
LSAGKQCQKSGVLAKPMDDLMGLDKASFFTASGGLSFPFIIKFIKHPHDAPWSKYTCGQS